MGCAALNTAATPPAGDCRQVKAPIALTLATLAAGCATAPRDIAPNYVSPLSYERYSCDQLAAEGQRLNARVATISGQQEDKMIGDAAALTAGFVLFPPLILLIGDGPQAQELGRLKGESDALQAAQQNCSSPKG